MSLDAFFAFVCMCALMFRCMIIIFVSACTHTYIYIYMVGVAVVAMLLGFMHSFMYMSTSMCMYTDIHTCM